MTKLHKKGIIINTFFWEKPMSFSLMLKRLKTIPLNELQQLTHLFSNITYAQFHFFCEVIINEDRQDVFEFFINNIEFDYSNCVSLFYIIFELEKLDYINLILQSSLPIDLSVNNNEIINIPSKYCQTSRLSLFGTKFQLLVFKNKPVRDKLRKDKSFLYEKLINIEVQIKLQSM